MKGYRNFKRLQNGEANYATVEFDSKSYASVQYTKGELHFIPTVITTNDSAHLMYTLTDADAKAAPFPGKPQEPAKNISASLVGCLLEVMRAELRGENLTTKMKWRFAERYGGLYKYVEFNESSYKTIIVSGDTFVSRPQVEGNQLVYVSYHPDDTGKEVGRAFWRHLPDSTRHLTYREKWPFWTQLYEDADLLSSDDVNYVSLELNKTEFRSILRTPRLKELVPVVKGNNLTYTVYVHSREVESDVSPHKVAEMLQVKTEDLQFTGPPSAVLDANRPRYVSPRVESPRYNSSGVYSPRYNSPGVYSFPSVSPGVYDSPGAQSPGYGAPRWRSYGSAAPRVNTVSWNVLLLLLSLAAWLV